MIFLSIWTLDSLFCSSLILFFLPSSLTSKCTNALKLKPHKKYFVFNRGVQCEFPVHHMSQDVTNCQVTVCQYFSGFLTNKIHCQTKHSSIWCFLKCY